MIKLQRGQSMVEFNLALPFMVPLVLLGVMLVVQWGFIFITKSTLDAATAQAVRTGALHHGGMSQMQESLAHGMRPLYSRDTSTTDAASSLVRARTDTALLSQVRILNPNNEVFDGFKHRVTYNGSQIFEIPNNNLMYRSPHLISLGDGRAMNLQDANLLHIEVRWCARLIVPIANHIMRGILTTFQLNPSPEQLACNAIGQVDGNVYLAVVSEATMRMQTPFRM